MQPDNIVPSYTNPQHLNRYMYVLGNPLKYIDPTGHMETCLGGCGRGANAEEIWKLFVDGNFDGVFAGYYAKLSVAERAVLTYKSDPTEANRIKMEAVVKDARGEKAWAVNGLHQKDLTEERQRYPVILGGGFTYLEFSLDDSFGESSGAGIVDPGNPFQQEVQTSTPTQTPTPTQTHRPIPTPRRYGGEILDF